MRNITTALIRRAKYISSSVAVLAIMLSPFMASVAHATLTLSAAPTITADNGSWFVNLNSTEGPFSQDVQYVLCWEPQPNLNNPWQTTCTTSAWASDAISAGYFGLSSPWIWPGHSDELAANARIYIQSVNTRPLPSQYYLNNVRVGIEMSEDNGGTLVGTNNGLCNNDVASDGAGIIGMTPASGGSTSGIAYMYGCQGSSDTPDDLRIFIAADTYHATPVSPRSGYIPSQVNLGQDVQDPEVAMKNDSTLNSMSGPSDQNAYPDSSSPGFQPNSWVGTATAASIGTCVDQDSQNQVIYPDSLNLDSQTQQFYDAPNMTTVPPGTDYHAQDGDRYQDNGDFTDYTCTTPVMQLTAGDLMLTHTESTTASGSFTTPNIVPYVVQSATRVSKYVGSGCVDTDHGDRCFDAGYSVYYTDSSDQLEIDNGDVATFYIPKLTAPTVPGTYNETWTLSDLGRPIPGGVYAQTIDVTGSTGTIKVHADIPQAAWCAYNSAHQWKDSGISGTDPSAVASTNGVTYNLEDYNCDSQTHPYGFSVASTAVYRNPSSILARVIKTAEASTCNDWICALTNGGTISYALTPEYCKIYVNASLNDPNAAGLAGVNFEVESDAPYINSSSGTTGSVPVSIQLITDKKDPNATPPSYPQEFDFATASLPATITVGGNIADFSGYTVTRASDGLVMSSNRNNFSIPTACAVNDSLTFNAMYKTRAVLDVH
jgi:hypothetical protein